MMKRSETPLERKNARIENLDGQRVSHNKRQRTHQSRGKCEIDDDNTHDMHIKGGGKQKESSSAKVESWYKDSARGIE